MTLKLYQKENKLWYFHRLGSEWPLGPELSKVLSFYDSIENNKTIYIKIQRPNHGQIQIPVAMFRRENWYRDMYGHISSALIYIINKWGTIRFNYDYKIGPGLFYIVKIW